MDQWRFLVAGLRGGVGVKVHKSFDGACEIDSTDSGMKTLRRCPHFELFRELVMRVDQQANSSSRIAASLLWFGGFLLHDCVSVE